MVLVLMTSARSHSLWKLRGSRLASNIRSLEVAMFGMFKGSFLAQLSCGGDQRECCYGVSRGEGACPPVNAATGADCGRFEACLGDGFIMLLAFFTL